MEKGLDTVEEERLLTASTTDVFNQTELRQAPGPGAVAIFLASDVADTLATVIVGGKVLKNNTIISKVGTNSPIDTEADSKLMAQVSAGATVRVDVTEVTPANIRVRATWMGVRR